jgi:hypothetical protein
MENKLKGGKADKMTIEKIAKIHKVSVEFLKAQVAAGMKIEREHTTDPKLAEEITLDHLFESPRYYIELKKMEKKIETKECTGADASGSFEGPLSGTILKKDIHKLHNYNPTKINEVADAGISAGAMYDGPVGTAGPSSPMDKTKKRKKDPLALDEKGSTASITAASTKDMISTKKGFPRFGGPDAKFVEIDAKCKKYPYCNQGDSGEKFKFISEDIDEAIKEAAEKYGFSVEEVKKVVSEALPVGMLDNPGNKKAMKSWTDKDNKTMYHIVTKEPIDITTDDEMELAKLKMIFYKHDIHFHDHVIKK